MTLLPPRAAADPALLVRGISPVLAVPFTSDGDIATEDFRRVVRHVLDTGVSSVMFPGLASEFYKLSAPERDELRDVLLQQTRGHPGVAAVISVTDHATRLAIQTARAAADAGADLLNLLPPHFLGPPADTLAAHLRAVLAAVTPTPVVLQIAPGQTGTSLSAPMIAEIAAEHANLRLVKVESAPPGRMVAALGAQRPSLPAVVGQAGLHMLDAFRRGAVGVQPGCSFSEIYMSIWRCLSSGDEAGADRIYRSLLPYISYWMQSVELIVAAEKLILTRRGLIGSAHCREPCYVLDATEVRMIESFLAEFSDVLER